MSEPYVNTEDRLLATVGIADLVVVETGSYFGEDDIVRFEDYQPLGENLSEKAT